MWKVIAYETDKITHEYLYYSLNSMFEDISNMIQSGNAIKFLIEGEI